MPCLVSLWEKPLCSHVFEPHPPSLILHVSKPCSHVSEPRSSRFQASLSRFRVSRFRASLSRFRASLSRFWALRSRASRFRASPSRFWALRLRASLFGLHSFWASLSGFYSFKPQPFEIDSHSFGPHPVGSLYFFDPDPTAPDPRLRNTCPVSCLSHISCETHFEAS